MLFNSFIFARSLMKGIFHAIVIFFVTFGCYYLNFYPSEGYEVDYQSFGYVASGALTFVVTLQVCCLIMCVVAIQIVTDRHGHSAVDSYNSYCHLGQYSVVVCMYTGRRHFSFLS